MLVIVAALFGCAPVMDRAAALLAPTEEVLELTLETPEALPRDAAIAFIIKRLNATQYGVVLHDVFSNAAKPFDYTDLFLRLQQKRVRGLFWHDNTYRVVLLNTCKAPEASGMQDFYEKIYSFSSLEDAKRVCAAFIAAGVRLCCDEGCDE